MIVKASPIACEASRQKALKEIRKEVSLPGFRQGHVPTEIVLKNYAPQVERHTKEITVSTAFEDAIKLVGRPPFSKNSLRKTTIKSISKESGAEIHFEYEATPIVPPIDIEKLHLEAVAPKLPSDQDVEHFFDWLLFSKSVQTPTEGRSPKEGDSIEIEISRTPDGPFESKKTFLRHGLIADWLFSSVLNMTPGESKEVTIPAQDNAPASTAYLKLLQVFDCILPEQNDAFANSVGEKSIETLRSNVRARLEYDAKCAAQERMRRQVRNELIRLYAFDLPQSLVENETEGRFQTYWRHASSTKEGAPLDKEAARKPFLEEVKRNLTCLLLLQQIFDEVKPSYTMSELTDEFRAQTTKTPPTQCVIHEKLEEKEVYNRLLSNIIIRQCEDYCIQKCLGLSLPTLAIEHACDESHDDTDYGCHEEASEAHAAAACCCHEGSTTTHEEEEEEEEECCCQDDCCCQRESISDL